MYSAVRAFKMLARPVVGLSVVLTVVLVVVVAEVVGIVADVVGGNLFRLPNGETLSFGLFFSEAEKLALFGGLENQWTLSQHFRKRPNLMFQEDCLKKCI